MYILYFALLCIILHVKSCPTICIPFGIENTIGGDVGSNIGKIYNLTKSQRITYVYVRY